MIILRSSTEAKLKSLIHTIVEVTWIQKVLDELQARLKQPPIVYCDNIIAGYKACSHTITSKEY